MVIQTVAAFATVVFCPRNALRVNERAEYHGAWYEADTAHAEELKAQRICPLVVGHAPGNKTIYVSCSGGKN